MPSRAERDLTLRLLERREGNAMLSAARDLDRLSHGADAAGDHFKTMSSHAHALNAEIEKTEARVKDLGKQFAATGDRKLFGDIRHERAALAEMHKLFDELTEEAKVAGAAAGSSFGGSFGGALDMGGSGIKPMRS